MKTNTEYFKDIFDSEQSKFIFEYLRDNILWEEGIKTRRGEHTRSAKAIGLQDDNIVYQVVVGGIKHMKEQGKKNNVSSIAILGCYLNYYRSGSDYTPTHSHPGTQQIIFSFGGERTLAVANKPYVMHTGSGIIFGSSQHGIAKQEYADPRISIALFCQVS